MNTDVQNNLSEVARRVHDALRSLGAFGRTRARTQAEVARLAGCATRAICDATLELNQHDVPVVSSCAEPPGIYIAERFDEFDDYIEQLSNRLRGNAIRLREVKRIRRRWEAGELVETTGQRRLFAETGAETSSRAGAFA